MFLGEDICCFLPFFDFLFFVGKATISNDGATIISLLDVVHPAAKTLVDISKSQDAEVCMSILPHSIPLEDCRFLFICTIHTYTDSFRTNGLMAHRR